MAAHFPGELAYLDSFAGLVPCRVLSVDADNTLTVKLTATRGAYFKGETLSGEPQRIVVPRECVRNLRGMSPRVLLNYHWRNAPNA